MYFEEHTSQFRLCSLRIKNLVKNEEGDTKDFPINKTRYLIKKGKHTFEVDIFEGENKGLIVAEIELSDANESFEKPTWLAEEVTGIEKYYNAYLSKKPFTKW